MPSDGDARGGYKRATTAFRSRVSNDDGCPFPPEAGRYHIYYTEACPWAHRVMIVRALKGLESVISCSRVHWLLEDFESMFAQGRDAELASKVASGEEEGYKGWSFKPPFTDPLHPEFTHTLDLYKLNDPSYPAKSMSVPILFDKKTNRIVNNESSDIIQILNSSFNGPGLALRPEMDLAPDALAAEMDAVDAKVFRHVNNGVYRCGFSTSQEAYDEGIAALFKTLDELEERLGKSRYLCSHERLTLVTCTYL